MIVDMTIGADGTTHRSIPYNAQHVHYKVTSPENIPQQKTRLLGVNAALDGSSEESVKAWKELFGNIADIYNESPLGKRSSHLLRTIDIFLKLRAMHSDHCAKEKKDVRLLEKEKLLATYQSLGEEEILDKSNQELLPHFMDAQNQMIQSVGGEAKWSALSETVKAKHEAAMLEQVVIKIGKDSFDLLSDDEKRILKLFIWAGCGCHKDLNTAKGGNTEMMAWWKINNVEGPVLLANRDNAAVLKGNQNKTDAAQERAWNISTRGGVKATKIAGDVLNNKDDKKGHHDTFRWWWLENVKEQFTFPDTSNTRFQTHCFAACAVMKDLEHFIDFLKFIREKKNVVRFSHMEENLWKALHCTATKTELAVLALYAQAISHPYMRSIRGSERKNTNALDLGPLHTKVYNHMQRIIEDPSFLLGSAVTHETGAMDGQEWESSEVIAAIHRHAPSLPHLSAVLVAFFKGAAETWKCFTSEYAPGGLIDEATVAEKEFAWMPPTNDVNEGALGSFHVLMRRQPHLTLLQYNAQAMFHKNETEAFMKTNFQSEDYQFIHKKARQTEVDHVELKRKQNLVLHVQARNEKKQVAREKRKVKAAAKAKRIGAVQLSFEKESINGLRGEKLKDHLLAFQKAGAPLAKTITTRTPVAQIREALKLAIDSYNNGEWKVIMDSATESDSDNTDSSEVLEIGSDDNEWEDWNE